MNWSESNRVQVSSRLEEKLQKMLAQSDVMDKSLGTIKGVQAKLRVKPDAVPNHDQTTANSICYERKGLQ